MEIILAIIYLVASVTFILGLKMLGHPETARRGNLIAAAGMTIAIFGTIFLYKVDKEISSLVYILIAIAIVIGTIIGWVVAKKVDMTKMPELVSMFNGMGGASAALIGLIEFHHYVGDQLSILTIIATSLAEASLMVPLILLPTPSPTASLSPKAPNITLDNGLFMALHMASVKMVPAEPTNIPPVSITMFPYKNPPNAAAKPVNEFNKDITTGISAPPIGSTNNTP